MKSISLFLFLTFTLVSNALAQKISSGDVPADVLQGFYEKFSDIKKVSWEKESEDVYEAEFKINGLQYSADFTIYGEWLETEQSISESEIPDEIMEYLNDEYLEFTILESELVLTPGETKYEIEIESEKTKIELLFTEEGKLLEKADHPHSK